MEDVALLPVDGSMVLTTDKSMRSRAGWNRGVPTEHKGFRHRAYRDMAFIERLVADLGKRVESPPPVVVEESKKDDEDEDLFGSHEEEVEIKKEAEEEKPPPKKKRKKAPAALARHALLRDYLSNAPCHLTPKNIRCIDEFIDWLARE